MSIAFFKRAFGFKKSPEEQQYEDFIKNFHLDVPVNLNNLSKLFRKNALRLIVVRNFSDPIIFDSLLQKDQPQMPSFMKGDKKVTLLEAAFGAIPLSKDKDLKFEMKVHDFKDSEEILISCVHMPTIKRIRCTNSDSYSRKVNEFTQSNSLNYINRYAINQFSSGKKIAVCLLINIDWIQPLAKSLNSDGLNPCFKPDSQLNQPSMIPSTTPSVVDNTAQCLSKRFHCMLFEHFIQISVLMESLTENIVRIINIDTGNNISGTNCTRLSTNSSPKFSIESHNEANYQFNRAFSNFQQAFRDLCIPKLARPVWSTLCLASAAEQDEMEEWAFDSISSIKSYKDSYLPVSSDLTYEKSVLSQYEVLTKSFVRGCLCIQISKAIARDKGHFLGQLITGLLMSHQGWISTVLPKEHDSQNAVSSCRNVCEAYNNNIQMGTQKQQSQPTTNMLLEQLLAQVGCNLCRHQCDNASLLSNSGNVFSTTVLFGQQQAQRDRLLALLYICSYFLRTPSLLQTHEQLPDLGCADLFDLERQRRPQARHGSKNRRKSGSLVCSSTGAAVGSGMNVNRGYASSDPHDSGISSQEDLTAAIYSVSAGSSPSHTNGISLCLPHRLTHEQCRMAETEAQFYVHREVHRQIGGVGNQNKFAISELPMPAFYNSTIPLRGHTWTAASSQTRLSSMIGILSSDMTMPLPPTSVSPVLSSTTCPLGVPGVYQLTEVPLLIEKSFNNSHEVCWCLGPLPSGNMLTPEFGSPSYPSSPFSVSQATSVARSPFGTGLVTMDSSSPSFTDISDAGNVEVGTACYAGMEETFSSSTSSLDPNLVHHCQVSASVMDQYTSGLALQATSEPLDSFRPRLHAELNSWLRYAPNLVRRAINSSTESFSPNGSSNFSSNSINFKCSALLVNVDASSVEILTIKDKHEIQNDSFNDAISFISNQSQTQNHEMQNQTETVPTRWISSSRYCEENSSCTSVNSVEPTINCNKGKAQSQLHTVTPAPSVIRLLESVKIIVDRSGCSMLALKHLETGLQLLYTRGRVLADLLITEGADVLQQPDIMAAVLGCPRGDLPLLLSIACFQSCRAAAVIQISDLDIHNLR